MTFGQCLKRSLSIGVLSLSFFSSALFADNRGFVELSQANNKALLVGVTYGLPGIDIDLDNVEKMTTHSDYQYQVSRLWEEEGTVEGVANGLTQLATEAGEHGTLFFYWSGHGSVGSILLHDRQMKVEEIRAAIETGRKGLGPLERLILVYDTCHAGSLMDPMRAWLPFYGFGDRLVTEMMVDDLVNSLAPSVREEPYWKKLFVFASSRADETSAAGSDGSHFTNAMFKAYNESIEANSTVGEFVKMTQKYTTKHHAVARLVPEAWNDEKMLP